MEGFLADLRARQANRLIPVAARSGRILDIGCGTYPAFLLKTRFVERFGIDRVETAQVDQAGVHIIAHDVASALELPFETDFFDVVTMLAVFEHLDVDVLVRLLKEVHRVLRPGGVYVMTTPAAWMEPILSWMSRVGLISKEELAEHKPLYTQRGIADILRSAGFSGESRSGTFEAGMNLWARAQKES